MPAELGGSEVVVAGPGDHRTAVGDRVNAVPDTPAELGGSEVVVAGPLTNAVGGVNVVPGTAAELGGSEVVVAGPLTNPPSAG